MQFNADLCLFYSIFMAPTNRLIVFDTVKYDRESFPVSVNVGHGIVDSKYHIYDITESIKNTAVLERVGDLRSDSDISLNIFYHKQ